LPEQGHAVKGLARVPNKASTLQAKGLERGNHVQAASSKQGLYLLKLQPGVPMDRSLMGEDALGLYGYDAVNVELGPCK